MTEFGATADFHAGYDAGRSRCLATGLEDAAIWRQAHLGQYSRDFWEGWSWATWDYEDANGLPHRASGA